MSPRTASFLIYTYFGMFLVALVYDYPVITTLPWYSLPFIVICPIYPLLIAAHLSRQKPHPTLQAFATIPPAVYGGLALCFYPLHMASNGFSWYGVGQMLWVLLYAIPALFLLPTRHSLGTFLACCFIGVSLTIQYYTLSYGYLDLAGLSAVQRLLLLAIGFFLIGVVAGVIKHNSLFNREK
jgi:hypothetical protein